jgi:tetratricopeptide (TPR) repeat protein
MKRPSGSSHRVAAWILFAGGVVLALPAMRAPFVLDDLSKIVNNPDIRDLGRLHETLVYPYSAYHVLERNDPSRPVVFATFALNHAVGGTEPLGYHLVNTILHALNGVLVFFWMRRLWRARGDPRGDETWRDSTVPMVVAALFLVSPVNVATSIYVYARSDVLGATFVLAATLFFVRDGKGSYIASLVCFVLALGTKQSVVVLPALLVLTDACVLGARTALKGRRLVRLLPFGAIVAAYLAYRFAYFGDIGDVEGRGNTWPMLDYAMIQPWVALRYAQLLLVPAGLAIDHQILPETLSTPQIAAGIGFVLLALGGAGLLAWKARGALVLAALGIVWFALCLSPTSSLLPTVDAMVERRVYLASVGFYAAIAVLGLRIVRWRAWRVALTALLLAVFLFAAEHRIYVHNDAKRLWSDVLRTYPKSVRAHNNLANLLVDEHLYADARALFEKLLAWNPADFIAHNNLGNLFNNPKSGFFDETRAARAFERAIALNPGYAAPHYNLGRIHQQRGDPARAEAFYLRALEILPAYALAHNNLGLLYFHAGRRDEARARYEAALRIDPACGPAKYNLALLERTPAGRESPGVGGGSAPDGGPAATADTTILAGTRPPTGARPVPIDEVPLETIVRLYEEALRKEPQNRAVRRKYADLCRRRKQIDCARAQYRRLLELEPNDAEVRRILDGL